MAYYFPGTLWFLVPRSSLGHEEVFSTILQGWFEDDETGKSCKVIYAFSDDYSAELFLKQAGSAAAIYTTFAPEDGQPLTDFLKRLQNYGHHVLGIDPSNNSQVIMPISEAIQQIESR